MQHQEGFFKGVRDINIYYQAWLPEDAVKAVLLVVHGLGEHSGRYLNVVNHFVPLGYAVYILDLPGHGKSDGVREFVEKFADYTDTVKIYYDQVRAWQPETPVFLVGHSLGGLIGAAYLIDHQAGLAGAVISAPLTKVPENISPTTVKLGQFLSRWLPKMGLIGLNAQGISRDPAVVQAYLDDPLVFKGKTPARSSAEMLSAMLQVRAHASQIILPLLIVQGAEDILVDPAGAQQLFELAGSEDKALKVFSGLHHEVFNEPEKEEVLSFVECWLAAH